jgi:hypothetical protein
MQPPRRSTRSEANPRPRERAAILLGALSMTEQELRDGIAEGKIENRVHEFYEPARVLCGYKRVTHAVCVLAFKLYADSVKDVSAPK